VRRHPPAWLAWPLAALALSGAVVSIAAVWLWPGLAGALLGGSAAGFTVDALQLVGAPVVGAVLASRRPEHPYGWLLLSLGLTGMAFGVTVSYGTLALVVMEGALPFGWVAAWLADISWGLMVLHLPFLFLLFPDGRLPSPRWRLLVWVMAGSAVLLYASAPLVPGPMGSVPVDKPIAIGGTAAALLEGVMVTSGYGLIGAAAVATVSVFMRRRRAGPQERLQLKWFAYAAALFAAMFPVTFFAGALIDDTLRDFIGPVFFGVAMNAVFVAVGVAVLRYRLYEIDRIVSRTVSYALLTALLAAVYLGGVLLLAPVLGRGSDLAVAAATLAAAALFAPARRRIQYAVDRRFNRAGYDAQRTVEAFAVRLRDQVDLAELHTELLAVMHRSVEPAAASLWLRPGEEQR
jgi:hypothetical protein